MYLVQIDDQLLLLNFDLLNDKHQTLPVFSKKSVFQKKCFPKKKSRKEEYSNEIVDIYVRLTSMYINIFDGRD